MASTATTRNRLEKQGTGENNNSWGTKLNTTALDLLDAALDGMEDYTLSGTKTLSSTNYAADESRMRFQNITGGTGGTVTIPAVEKLYLVRNGSSGDVIFTTGSGTTATIESGNIEWVVCDATNVYLAQTRDFGASLVSSTGVPSTDAHLANKLYVDGAIAAAGLSSIPGLGSAITDFLTSPTSSNLRAAVSDETGTGSLVFATSPTLVTPILGTPTSGTLTNCTGFPLANLTGAGTGVLTLLGTPSSANLRSAITDETGTGSLVFATSPTLVTPILGTPTSGTLSNCTTATQSPGDNSTKLASTAYVDAAAAAVGGGTWSLVDQEATTSGTSWTLTVDDTTAYSDLLILILGFSHNNGSAAQLQAEFSQNAGGTWCTAIAFGASGGNNASTMNGSVFIPGNAIPSGSLVGPIVATSIAVTANLFAVDTAAKVIAHCGSSPVDAIRFSVVGGYTGDAGLISLYGRV